MTVTDVDDESGPFFYLDKKIPQKLVKKIDLHGFTLENANKEIEKFINKFYENKISKIILINRFLKGCRYVAAAFFDVQTTRTV